jgi:O-antigen/teichoic acid export membrane protein
LSLRRQLLVSFAVQGAGAASVLLATLWLGARLGPEVQGGFSRAKSEIEFIAAFAMFGLPQALFFQVKSGRLSLRSALRWAGASALLALPIGVLYAVVEHPPSVVLAGLLGLTVAACVAQGQLRALLLVRERVTAFNAMTAAPQVLVLGGVGCVMVGLAAAGPAAWFGIFLVAYGLTAGLAWMHLRATRAGPVVSTVGWRELGHYGLAAWLTAALSTAAILAMQRWVEAAAGRAALGQFTLAMTLVQVPLTPIAYAAPLLLRRWMDQPGARASRRLGARLFALLLVVAAGVGLLSTHWPDLGLGAAYAGATAALALLLVGGAAEAASRVLTVQASATGLPWIAVRAETARWGVLAIGWWAPLPGGVLPLCAIWSAAALAAALAIAVHSRAVSGATTVASP